MPADAKLGLVIGLSLVLVIAVVFFRKEAATASGKPVDARAQKADSPIPPPSPPPEVPPPDIPVPSADLPDMPIPDPESPALPPSLLNQRP